MHNPCLIRGQSSINFTPLYFGACDNDVDEPQVLRMYVCISYYIISCYDIFILFVLLRFTFGRPLFITAATAFVFAHNAANQGHDQD